MHNLHDAELVNERYWYTMEKLLLVGSGGFGRVVLEHAGKDYECAFLDDGPEIGTLVDGVPVIGRTAQMQDFFPEYTHLVVSIGNNALREKLYKEAKSIGYTFPNIIVSSAYISPRATIGTGCVILNNAVVQNDAHLGDGCILNPGVEAHHSCYIGDYCLIYTNSVIRSLTHVGDRAWIGSTVSISTGAVVPEDAVIKDGEVVEKQQ